MANKEKTTLAQFLSALTLILYAVIIAIKWVMVYQEVPEAALTAVDIIRSVVLCLMIIITMCNALRSTGNPILKIIYLAISLFLIASAVAVRVPAVQDFFIDKGIPPVF